MNEKDVFTTEPTSVMEDQDMFEVIYVCRDSYEAYRFGTHIHKQLVGNQDYIENRIIININGKTEDGRYFVRLLIGNNVSPIPKLDLNLNFD